MAKVIWLAQSWKYAFNVSTEFKETDKRETTVPGCSLEQLLWKNSETSQDKIGGGDLQKLINLFN